MLGEAAGGEAGEEAGNAAGALPGGVAGGAAVPAPAVAAQAILHGRCTHCTSKHPSRWLRVMAEARSWVSKLLKN